jgi:hypothetical protein
MKLFAHAIKLAHCDVKKRMKLFAYAIKLARCHNDQVLNYFGFIHNKREPIGAKCRSFLRTMLFQV